MAPSIAPAPRTSTGRNAIFSVYGRRFDLLDIRRGGGILRIHEHGRPCHARRDFFQHFEPLRTQLAVEEGHASDVSSRACEARHDAVRHRVGGYCHDDGDGARRFPRRLRSRRAVSDNDLHPGTHELGREPRQALVLAFGPAEFDGEVLPLDVAEVTQARAQALELLRVRGRRDRAEEADAGDLGRLRAWAGTGMRPATMAAPPPRSSLLRWFTRSPCRLAAIIDGGIVVSPRAFAALSD